MNYSREAQDLDFAYKVRHALNESAERLPAPTLDRLANARKIAMSRKKQSSPSAVLAFGGVLAGAHGFSFGGPNSWLGKLGVALPMLVLIVGLMGIYEYEQQRRISDLADIDVAVLADELPPDAYLDTGFSAYLNKAEE
ncbi:DUF3619 family protein [Undibacterium sp. RuTC16W]|uniref:DUF3619 family protein n=1 Tax=Undibacterium sp. RuTC16W TaxID=3413048 RepID=UPI003BF4398E